MTILTKTLNYDLILARCRRLNRRRAHVNRTPTPLVYVSRIQLSILILKKDKNQRKTKSIDYNDFKKLLVGKAGFLFIYLYIFFSILL